MNNRTVLGLIWYLFRNRPLYSSIHSFIDLFSAWCLAVLPSCIQILVPVATKRQMHKEMVRWMPSWKPHRKIVQKNRVESWNHEASWNHHPLSLLSLYTKRRVAVWRVWMLRERKLDKLLYSVYSYSNVCSTSWLLFSVV